jgi:hypothetical protein
MEAMAGDHLDPATRVGGRMFDQRDEAGGHVPTRAHGDPRPRHLADLHDTALRDDLDQASDARGHEVRHDSGWIA